MTFVAQENDLSLACGHLLPETSCLLLDIASAVNLGMKLLAGGRSHLREFRAASGGLRGLPVFF